MTNLHVNTEEQASLLERQTVALEKIAECLLYLTSEQIANTDANEQIRWLGDGLDDSLQ